jgi:membrane-associated protease RseP (regulator of RpoE activity)
MVCRRFLIGGLLLASSASLFAIDTQQLVQEQQYYESELDRLRSSFIATLLEHPQATAAFLLGGSAAAGSLSEQIDPQYKPLLAGVALGAVLYCAFEAPSECSDVASGLASVGTRINATETKLQSIKAQLSIKGKYILGFIGENLTYFLHDGQQYDYGVRIAELMPNMPAMNAGLQKGDVIYLVDDDKVQDVPYLLDYMNRKPGQAVRIAYIRDGSTYAVNVTPVLNR